MTHYKFDRDDITDLVPLQNEISAAVGRPVAISARVPQTVEDEDGTTVNLGGDLMLVDPNTGEELEGLDEQTIDRVVTNHVPAPPPPPRGEVLAAAERKMDQGDTEGALRDLLAMLKRG